MTRSSHSVWTRSGVSASRGGRLRPRLWFAHAFGIRLISVMSRRAIAAREGISVLSKVSLSPWGGIKSRWLPCWEPTSHV